MFVPAMAASELARGMIIILSVTCHGLGNFPPLIHSPSYPFVNFQNPTSGVEWIMKGWSGSYRDGWGEVGHRGVGLCEVQWVMLGWSGLCRGEVGHTGVE